MPCLPVLLCVSLLFVSFFSSNVSLGVSVVGLEVSERLRGTLRLFCTAAVRPVLVFSCDPTAASRVLLVLVVAMWSQTSQSLRVRPSTRRLSAIDQVYIPSLGTGTVLPSLFGVSMFDTRCDGLLTVNFDLAVLLLCSVLSVDVLPSFEVLSRAGVRGLGVLEAFLE